jgi:hypothetical protein
LFVVNCYLSRLSKRPKLNFSTTNFSVTVRCARSVPAVTPSGEMLA